MNRFVAYLAVFCLGGVAMADGPIAPVSPSIPAATVSENAAAAEAPVISASEIKEAAKAVAEAAQTQTRPEDFPAANKSARNTTFLTVLLAGLVVSAAVYLIANGGRLSKHGTGRRPVVLQYQHPLQRLQFQSR